jgi:hypothetical protein
MTWARKPAETTCGNHGEVLTVAVASEQRKAVTVGERRLAHTQVYEDFVLFIGLCFHTESWQWRYQLRCRRRRLLRTIGNATRACGRCSRSKESNG